MNKDIRNWALAVLATIAVVGISYFEVRILKYSSFGFSISFNFQLMAWYTILVNLFKPKMDWRYFKAHPFEREGKLYTYFGVYYYRKLLVWVGWEKLHRLKHPMKFNSDALRARDYSTREAELGHLVIALIVLAFTIAFARTLNEAKWLLITNLFLNVFPVFLQRYNRPRYSRLINNGIKL